MLVLDSDVGGFGCDISYETYDMEAILPWPCCSIPSGFHGNIK